MKPLGWALLASVCFVGNMLGDLGLIDQDDATSWGTVGVLFAIAFLVSGERS